jgi:hypothetical protein
MDAATKRYRLLSTKRPDRGANVMIHQLLRHCVSILKRVKAEKIDPSGQVNDARGAVSQRTWKNPGARAQEDRIPQG